MPFSYYLTRAFPRQSACISMSWEWLETLSVFLKLLMVPCQEQLEKLKQNSLAKEPILVPVEDSSSLSSLSYVWQSLVWSSPAFWKPGRRGRTFGWRQQEGPAIVQAGACRGDKQHNLFMHFDFSLAEWGIIISYLFHKPLMRKWDNAKKSICYYCNYW